MKTGTFPKISSKGLTPFTGGRLVLPLLLLGHLFCLLLIYFKYSPGLQSWAVLPIINGLVIFWLLAKPQTQLLNCND
jgi:hypothetical protein